MTRRPPRKLANQAFALYGRFPDAQVKLNHNLLDWTAEIQPTAASRTYRVRIVYRLHHYPKVRVVSPILESRPGESLPHVYDDGSLCLHLKDDWTPDMLLLDTTIPWTSEWLIYYEIWKFTGEWYGGGEWPSVRRTEVATATDVTLPGSPTQAVSEPR